MPDPAVTVSSVPTKISEIIPLPEQDWRLKRTPGTRRHVTHPGKPGHDGSPAEHDGSPAEHGAGGYGAGGYRAAVLANPVARRSSGNGGPIRNSTLRSATAPESPELAPP
jgi:hypothetical protein